MTTDASSNKAQPIRVLLVDDHDYVLWGLRKLIEGEMPRMTVTGTAKTLKQAFATLEEKRPDVLVLDLYLGEQYTLEHLPALRASGAAIVILTSARDAEAHRRAVRGGARTVVLKDEPAEVLLHEIKRANEWRNASAACQQNCQSAVETGVTGFVSSTTRR
ncbi:MAG TPA: response regulator transcription factor [Burkholderiales bacterium]|nr:response regulator transcription factor [Burkholderiales bacterium]